MDRSPGRLLREFLGRAEPLLLPGVVSPLFARLAYDAGFEALYATGAGISNMTLGLPDLGLMGMSELAAVSGRIAEATPLPVLADIDTGYGNALNVTRTVREFENHGVAGVQIEDQVNPKRCGHFDDKAIVSRQEMLERVFAAVEARRDPDLVIVARTDAIAVEGISSAILRANDYAAAGADLVFVEAPTSSEELRAIADGVAAPLMINMVEGGRTPVLAPDELASMGFAVILYANSVLRMAMAGANTALRVLKASGGTVDLLDQMVTWPERQAAVRLDEWLSVDARVASLAARLHDARGD
ncbi:2-methylisocitrate lyase-like PEP mutase family enzyme [Antricoccus suffuscus]|uniref:2-methylisocitrate lyase n=1 Tax=Antricoccus suffuscus TaxID=1629062 RepID=A0A2T1A109_9ACTN|nr:isocitrate lyase/phosphoenolpyruvate mutase family protein [Antricoccus suffuscus]PRZ42177.1 2-methylisocitrate lyase-like PEP mutase family enzyme [Antricoccus suffuscus]